MPTVEVYKEEVADLENFVKNATWRDLLIELVEKNKLDPWDINISEITYHYLNAVSNMKVLDLHIPANIILAASLLLRMKSEMLIDIGNSMQAEDAEEIARIVPETPSLVSRLRLQPNKRVTLDELIEALGEAMKIRQSYTQVQVQKPHIAITISAEDIDAKLEKVYRLAKESMDSEHVCTFSVLCAKFKSVESILIDLFVPLLILGQQGRLLLRQDEFFDELFIILGDEANAR
ncbi:MAG: segregation/condensation protein A [Candidatus Micrarchaeia archaeon]